MSRTGKLKRANVSLSCQVREKKGKSGEVKKKRKSELRYKSDCTLCIEEVAGVNAWLDVKNLVAAG